MGRTIFGSRGDAMTSAKDSAKDRVGRGRTVRLGATGPSVLPIGLGCMGMSGMYGATDDEESVRTIEAAIDAGVGLFDTGDFYGMGHNELLIGRAIRGKRDKVTLSVKLGALRLSLIHISEPTRPY